MPTGYTADIKDGISFEQFALNCARAFGACITMRDLPSGTAIPAEFEPSMYNADKLAEAREELQRLESLSTREVELACTLEYRAAEDNRRRRLQENQDQLECYRGMLAQVETWTAPTEEHDGLKKFMREQIEESIRFDDSTGYYATPTPFLNPVEWLESKKTKALKDIEYHKEQHAAELKRTAYRNQWVRQLRESLK